MDLKILQLYKIPILMVLSCLAFYFTFGYGLDRTDFSRLIMLYAALCFLSYKLFVMQRNDFRFLAGAAILFRLIFLVSLPELSQDFYRFIWDGKLIASGWNPYQYIPNDLIKIDDFQIPNAQILLDGMGSLSAGHYSNYPPINQLIFAISGWLSGKSILIATVILRLFIILADIGTMIIGSRMLKSLGLPANRIFWYILNPFIIIEMTGNLHFESVMVFFLVWALYLLHRKKWILSAVIFGLSISVKLLPLMLLPLFFKYFIFPSEFAEKEYSNQNFNTLQKSNWSYNLGKLSLFYIICIGTVILSFLPFYSTEVFQNFMASVGLWFGKFEFNASIYYLVRWIGYQVKGYNIIETAGKVLPIFSLLMILFLTFFRNNSNLKQLIKNMLFAVSFYLLLSTTVHPWYLAIPLILSVFTEFKYMLIWSIVVMLSYYAYSNFEYQENLWLVALEYMVVLGYFGYEIRTKKISL